MMKALLAALLLCPLLTDNVAHEREPNDVVPIQKLGLLQPLMDGSLSSDADVDRYIGGLGKAYPFVTWWVTSMTVQGQPGQELHLTIWEDGLWYPPEIIADKRGVGTITVTYFFTHHPYRPNIQVVQLQGSAGAYTIRPTF